MSLELRMKSHQEMGVAAQGFRGKHRVFLDSEWSHTQILPLAGIKSYFREFIYINPVCMFALVMSHPSALPGSLSMSDGRFIPASHLEGRRLSRT